MRLHLSITAASASLIALFGMMQGADAAVVVTTLTPSVYRPAPQVGQGTETHYDFDLNADGIPDFDLSTNGFGVNLIAHGSNRIADWLIFGAPDTGGMAEVLTFGQRVGPFITGQSYDWNGSYASLVAINGFTFPPTIYGRWGSNRGYLGLEFQINGETHYGWAQVYMPATENAAYLEAWGYESTPNTVLYAGMVPEPSRALFLLTGILSLLHRRRRTLGSG